MTRGAVAKPTGTFLGATMGKSHRKDDIAAQIRRVERDGEAMEDALASVLAFNARLAAGRTAWSWPTIGAALATRHHWLSVSCDACGTVIELDLRVRGATRRHPSGLLFAMCVARGAMAADDRASLPSQRSHHE